MIKKHSVLICIVISVILIIIAALLYPGGSLFDKNLVGFDWTKNFISNLFAAKAINGLENPSRIWAILGVAFHSVGSGIFFINMSKKMTDRHAATVLNYIGIASITFDVLIVTSLHDVMVMVSSTLSLLGLFLLHGVYSKVKTPRIKIRLCHLPVDFLLHSLLIRFRRLGIIGHHAEGIVHQFNAAGFRNGVFYQKGRLYTT